MAFNNPNECGVAVLSEFPVLQERARRTFALDSKGSPLTFVLIPDVFLPYLQEIFDRTGQDELKSRLLSVLDEIADSDWQLSNLFRLEVAPPLLENQQLLRAVWDGAGQTTRRLLTEVAATSFPNVSLPKLEESREPQEADSSLRSE